MNSPLPVIVVRLTTPAKVLTNPCASLWLYLYILYYLTYCASYNKKNTFCAIIVNTDYVFYTQLFTIIVTFSCFYAGIDIYLKTGSKVSRKLLCKIGNG